MKKRTLFFAAALIALATGCAAPLPQIDYYDVETEALERIRGMTVLDDASIASGGYRSLGEVKGLYCDRNQMQISPGDSGEQRIAVEQIKLRAARLGADYISAPSCDPRSGMDMTNNCMATLVCRAEALAAAGD